MTQTHWAAQLNRGDEIQLFTGLTKKQAYEKCSEFSRGYSAGAAAVSKKAGIEAEQQQAAMSSPETNGIESHSFWHGELLLASCFPYTAIFGKHALYPAKRQVYDYLESVGADVLVWLKNNNYGDTGHSRCLEQALSEVTQFNRMDGADG